MSYNSDNYEGEGDDDVVVIENDNDEIIFSPEADDYGLVNLESVVSTYSAFMYGYEATLDGRRVSFNLPSTFLPLSMRAVYGYTVCETLLEVEFELDGDCDWNRMPSLLSIKHPVYGTSYVGKPLVMMAVQEFFTPFYKQKPRYRSANYLLHATGTADPKLVAKLKAQGFDVATAEKALVACENDFEKTVEFLKTGDPPRRNVELSVGYHECPLLYLVLEMADAFLDLSDHCCNCRAPLPAGIKPSVCSKPLCNFQLSQLGVGSSVWQEIQRDPDVADIVFSMFSAAYGTPYCTPEPPMDLKDFDMNNLFATMPRMRDIVAQCHNDQEIGQMITKEALDILRWVLLSNRSHLVTVPSRLRLPGFDSAQFMTLMDSPEKEHIFNVLKSNYGSMWLFHGSHGERWHSILRNGLKNASGTSLQRNGAALGSGIYFARASNTSWGYSQPSQNKYAASIFGKQLHIISLCEIAKIPSNDVSVQVPSLYAGQKDVCVKGHLKDHQWAHTLTLEEACVVRFLFVGGSFQIDTIANPPQHIPTFRDVLLLHADGKASA